MRGELNQPVGRAERLVHGVSRVLRTVASVLMFFMMLFVAADVIGRYCFNAPFKGSSDLVELLMGLVVFFGMAYCAQVDGHTRVDVLYNYLPVRVRASLDVITFAASLFVYILIAWRLFIRAWGFLMDPASSPVTDLLHIPHVYFIFLAALGSAVLSLELVVHILRSMAWAR